MQYCCFMVITPRRAKEQPRTRPWKGQVSFFKKEREKGTPFFQFFESLILTVNQVVIKYSQTWWSFLQSCQQRKCHPALHCFSFSVQNAVHFMKLNIFLVSRLFFCFCNKILDKPPATLTLSSFSSLYKSAKWNGNVHLCHRLVLKFLSRAFLCHEEWESLSNSFLKEKIIPLAIDCLLDEVKWACFWPNYQFILCKRFDLLAFFGIRKKY